MDRRCYVYTHTRLDTNEVFYVGRGTISPSHINSKSNRKRFNRAYNKSYRNQWWLNIVEKTEYTVEIIKDSLTIEEANQLEIRLISEYKRKDCCEGILVNLTDGGEGCSGVKLSPERVEEIRKRNSGSGNHWYQCKPENHPMFGRTGKLNPYFGKKHSEEVREKMRGKRECISGENHPKSKLILNLETGIYYFSSREACETTNKVLSTFKNNINGTNKTNFTSFIQV